MIHVTVWNEHVIEETNSKVARIYPQGMHGAIRAGLSDEGIEVHTATFAEPEHGLMQSVLDRTDVLIWWGHAVHAKVQDEVVERIHARVLQGMGLIVLHSGHYSKIFKKLMGTSCNLKYRDAGELERLWVVDPAHPIAHGLGPYIELPSEEMYGEHFDIPTPDELVFVSWFEGGEIFRSGCCYHRGQGKVFYFRPGHESYPTYHNRDVLHVIRNAVQWAASSRGSSPL